MPATAAWGATALSRRRQDGLADRMAAAVLAATLAVLVSRPVGLRLQRDVTTLADVAGLRIASISRRQWRSLVIHFVALHDGP